MDLIIKRLASLGYVVTELDTCLLEFCTAKIENHIKNACNISSIPDGLWQVVVERICGEFLFVKKASGMGFDFEAVVKTVSAGDTTVTFDVGQSAEAHFDNLLHTMMCTGEGDLACYRKIKW